MTTTPTPDPFVVTPTPELLTVVGRERVAAQAATLRATTRRLTRGTADLPGVTSQDVRDLAGHLNAAAVSLQAAADFLAARGGAVEVRG